MGHNEATRYSKGLSDSTTPEHYRQGRILTNKEEGKMIEQEDRVVEIDFTCYAEECSYNEDRFCGIFNSDPTFSCNAQGVCESFNPKGKPVDK